MRALFYLFEQFLSRDDGPERSLIGKEGAERRGFLNLKVSFGWREVAISCGACSLTVRICVLRNVGMEGAE